MPETGFCIHELNAVYIKSLDRWASDKLMHVLEENTDALYIYLNCLPDNIFEYKKASIMNMYTTPEYRRQGIGLHTLDLLVKDANEQGGLQIALEATDMGRLLYERYGFVKMEDEIAGTVSEQVTDLQPWECLMK